MKKKYIKPCLIGVFIGGIGYILKNYIKDIVNNYENERNRYMGYYYIIKEWLYNNQQKISILEYLEKNNIKKIAIYGIGTLGEMFFHEIKNTDIKVEYVIDQCINKNFHGITVTKLENINQQSIVDAIIITPIYDYTEIAKKIESYNSQLLKISLEKLILLKK